MNPMRSQRRSVLKGAGAAGVVSAAFAGGKNSAEAGIA